MSRSILATALAVLVLVPALGLASVPSGTPALKGIGDGTRPTAVTFWVECVIVEVLEGRTLKIRDEEGRMHQIQIPEDAKIKPRRKRDFDGLRELDFAHLQAGFELKLKILTATGEILKVKVLDTEAA